MARTVQCIHLKKEGEGMDYAPYPGELGQENLQSGQQGSLAIVDETSNDAGEREPAESCRPTRPPVSGPPDGNFFFGTGAEQPAGYVPPTHSEN